MKRSSYRALFFRNTVGFVIFCVISLSSGPAVSSPSEQDIDSYVLKVISNSTQGQIADGPAPVVITSIELKVFDGSTSDTGRVSVVGEFAIQSDLYERGSFLFDELANTGASQVDIEWAAQALGWAPHRFKYDDIESRVTYSSGTQIAFRAELGFRETVSGYDMMGDVSFKIPFAYGSSRTPVGMTVGSDVYEKEKENFLKFLSGRKWTLELSEVGKKVEIKGFGPYDMGVITTGFGDRNSGGCTSTSVLPSSKWQADNGLPQEDPSIWLKLEPMTDVQHFVIAEYYRKILESKNMTMDWIVERIPRDC